MPYEVSYSPLALGDLTQLQDYVTHELGSPTSAEALVNHIMNAVDTIAGFPAMGTSLTVLYDGKAPYLYVREGDWLAFYHVIGERLFVDRVLYGRSDYLRALLG